MLRQEQEPNIQYVTKKGSAYSFGDQARVKMKFRANDKVVDSLDGNPVYDDGSGNRYVRL